MTDGPQPFRYGQLPAVGRRHVELTAVLQARMPPWVSLAVTLERALATRVTAETTTLAVLDADPAESALPAGWLSTLVDSAGRCLGRAHVDAPLVQALAGRLLGGAPTRVEVRPLLPAEDEAMGLLFSVLLGTSGVPLAARNGGDDRLEGGPIGRLMAHVGVDGQSGWVTLWFVPSLWPERSRARRGAERRQRLGRSPLRLGWSLDAQVRLARFAATPAERSQLDIGDVLLPGEWRGQSAPARGELRLAGIPVATVALDWSRRVECRVVDPSPSGEPDVTNPDDQTRQTLEILRPVADRRTESLEIVVGTTRLALGELLELGPGHTFTLDVPVDAPVDLVLDGRPIGRGELVEVEGRLGVRITAIAR